MKKIKKKIISAFILIIERVFKKSLRPSISARQFGTNLDSLVLSCQTFVHVLYYLGLNLFDYYRDAITHIHKHVQNIYRQSLVHCYRVEKSLYMRSRDFSLISRPVKTTRKRKYILRCTICSIRMSFRRSILLMFALSRNNRYKR